MVFALLAMPIVQAIELDEDEISSTKELFGSIVDSFNNQEGTVRGIIKYAIGTVVLVVTVILILMALFNSAKGTIGKKTGNAGLQNSGLQGNAMLLAGVVVAVMAIAVIIGLLDALGT